LEDNGSPVYLLELEAARYIKNSMCRQNSETTRNNLDSLRNQEDRE